MSCVVRISRRLIPYLDAAIEQMRDRHGEPLFKHRADVVNAAVWMFIEMHSLKPKEASTQLPQPEREAEGDV